MHVVWGHVAKKLCLSFRLENTWKWTFPDRHHLSVAGIQLWQQNFFTFRGWKTCKRGQNAAVEEQVHYPLTSDAIALWFTSPQSNCCQIEAESCSSSSLQAPPHPSLNPPPPPTSNPIVFDSSKIWEQIRVPGQVSDRVITENRFLKRQFNLFELF